uniref:Uncharacterized protein n=1 Tax=Glossina austeni TaxID=7395 RepID=A0A1A9UPU4_GLOAU
MTTNACTIAHFPVRLYRFATAHAHSKCFDLLRPSLNCKVEANNYYSNKTHLPIILTTRLSRRIVNHKQQHQQHQHQHHQQQQQQQQQPRSVGLRIKPNTSWRDTSYSMFKVFVTTETVKAIRLPFRKTMPENLNFADMENLFKSKTD